MNDNMPGIREMYLAAQTARIYVRAVGNPDANKVLINIHGGPGLSHTYMRGLEQLASSELLVISYDQRGGGRSSVAASQEGGPAGENFTPLTYVEDLEVVRQALAGSKKIYLLGHSWGGYVAMEYAIRYPEHLHSLVLVESIPPTLSGQQAGRARFQERLQELQHKRMIPKELSTDSIEYLKQLLPAYVFSPDSLSRFPSDALEYAPEVGQQTWDAVGNYDLRKSVAKITCPLLLLFGDTDPFGVAWAEETREAFSQAPITYIVIPHCGHFGWVEEPEIFFGALRNFLQQQDT